MLRSVSTAVLALAVASLAAAVAPPAAPAPAPAPAKGASARPNFIFIQGEAQGWSSTSVDMDGQPPSTARPAGLTPNLERMAADGMRFADFHVTAPRCTPSRTSFVTGISPAKLHMTYQNEGGASRREGGGGGKGGDANPGYNLMRTIAPTPDVDLPEGVRTTGGWLHDLGYASAHYGKWHVGRKAPSAVGFDDCDGANSNQGPDRGEAPNPKQATAITDRAIAFMRRQHAAGKPFYVQIDHYGFGAEEEATPESLAIAKGLVPNVSGKPMGAIAGAHDVDLQVGRVLAALKEMGIDGNTYVFYGADHGAQGGGGNRQANPPFSGAKGSVSEGGIRIPFIVRGPGIEAGKVSHVRASGMDLLPTVLDLAGAPVAKPADPDARNAIEGGSLVPVLRAGGTGSVTRPRNDLVIHFPHYDLGNGGPATAIYADSLKLVHNYDTGKTMLYDISKDPAERNDLSASMPEQVKQMKARMDDYLKAVKAQMPVPAPADGKAPAAPAGGDQPKKGGGGKGGGGKGGKNGGSSAGEE